MNSNDNSLHKWIDTTTETLKDYLAENETGPVVKYLAPLCLKESFKLSLGKSLSFDECWILLKEILDKSVRTSHPMFMNQLFGGIQPEALSAEILATALNPTMATFEVAPVMTLIEKELVRKICDIIGFKLGEGIMVTGGSNANLVGLLCARQFKIPDIKKRGYAGKNYTVYVSADAHYSYEKAAHISGLGLDQLKFVNVDEHGAMDPTHLRELILQDKARGNLPMMIGATAGTTVRGAFDPLTEIGKIAREHNLWLHVDAAWGGGVALSEKYRHYLTGIHLADSITFDAHKTFSTGLVTSFFLCKHPGMLKQMNQGGGHEYIFHDYDNSDWDTGTYSLQCGRRADALKFWLLWKSRGDKGMELIINHLIELSHYVKEKIQTSNRFELLSSNYLNNCFQVIPPVNSIDINQYNLELRTKLVTDGKALVNYVQKPDGQIFFRHVCANNLTEEKDIDRLFEELNFCISEIDKIYIRPSEEN